MHNWRFSIYMNMPRNCLYSAPSNNYLNTVIMQGQTQPNYFVMMVLQHEHEAKIKFFICLGKRNSSLLCWENTTSPTFNTQEIKSIEYHK